MPSKRTIEASEPLKRIRRSPRVKIETERSDSFSKLEPSEVKVETAKIKLEATQIKLEATEIKIERDSNVQDSLAEYSNGPKAGEDSTNLKQEPGSPKIKVEIETPINIFRPISPEDVLPGQPRNWNLVYNEIVRMRALITTPVDKMGCERIPETIEPGVRTNNPLAFRFRLLISLMLSSQTKDETTYTAIERLTHFFQARGYPGLCLEGILGSTEAEIDECIQKVGFHRRKAVYIKKSCELLEAKFAGDIPNTIEDVVSLPGVGPKMGHLLLQSGWGINLGIGVDVHLHRLAQMWGWVPKSTNPEKTRLALQEWVPPQYWGDINPLLVGFGQTVCVPNAGNCDVCTLASGLCSKANRKLSVLTEARLVKLGKQRGDLSGLVRLKLEKEALASATI